MPTQLAFMKPKKIHCRVRKTQPTDLNPETIVMGEGMPFTLRYESINFLSLLEVAQPLSKWEA
jgi:hypothetical protein